MSKVNLIVRREYLTRVRKKSFIVMSVLGPILFAAFMLVPAWLATMEDTEVKKIAVVDSSKVFIGELAETEYIKFDYLENENLEELKHTYESRGYYGVLYIAHIVSYSPSAVIFYSGKQPPMSLKSHMANEIETYIEDLKLLSHDIENLNEILQSIETDIDITTIKLSDTGDEKESSTGVAMAVGYAGGFLIYFFIFLFGAQVMRGVIEEKSNRIIEVMISSVKPFQLMMGKIVGIALVGLTQFLLWIILTVVLVTAAQQVFFPETTRNPTEQALAQDILTRDNETVISPDQPAPTEDMEKIGELFDYVKTINFGLILGAFLFFFLGGYLLYGSLFAAVGAAVDNETDTQQFMFPITIPLVIGIFVMINTINNPESPVSYWFSIIPFTSPIVMMVRIPFGVPYWDLVISAVLLILTFIGTTWLAGKIYRVGILMYGKKVNYKELYKWIKYHS
jgi:ABC-2 type transport system permease protein